MRILALLAMLWIWPQAAISQEQPMKLLVLITASDDLPVYLEHQRIWRSYMHEDPAHVEAYFMKANPDLAVECEIKGDVIWCRSEDAVRPGALNKTVLCLEYLYSRLDEFDYILRTNLSSFYDFPRLFQFMQTLPKNRCYSGRPILPGSYIGSGAGFILSKDTAKLLADAKLQLWNNREFDDCVIGDFFLNNHVPLIPAPCTDFCSMEAWMENQNNIPKNAFHFRCKNNEGRLRSSDEVVILTELVHRFCGVSP